jgi:Leucine-rich repeat (LRR) protein
MSALEVLDDVESLRRLKDSARLKLYAALHEMLEGRSLSRLGWMRPRVGAKNGPEGPPIPRFSDSERDIAFNVIPGGTLLPGPTPRMRKLLEARRKKAREEERDLIDAILAAPAKPKPVHIAPFLLGWVPLDAENVGNILGETDVRGAPAEIPRELVTRLVETSGYVLPTEHEWEWAYRGCMDTLFFWGDDDPTPARFTAVAEGIAPAATNAFGVMGMGAYPEICADGAVRGGAAPLFPFQGLGEGLLALGIRGERSIPPKVCVRLVLRLADLANTKSAQPKAVPAKREAATRFTTFATALRAPDSVTELVVREAKLAKIPPKISTLKKLRRLDLCGNALRELPAELAALPELEFLDVTANRIVKIAPALAKMPKLRILRVSDGATSWRAVPKAFDTLIRLPSLESLTIHATQSLKRPPESVENHPRLSHLSMWLCRSLDGFPTSVFAMPRLADLDLSDARFGALPEKIEGLAELRTLRLSGTEITRLPRAFCELALVELRLGDNPKLALDAHIARLAPTLERLFLNGMHTPLPKEIGRLKKLRTLVLSNGTCPRLPDWVSALESLEELVVSNNDDLTEIPDAVLRLPNLKRVSCYNTPLEEPKALAALQKRYPKLAIGRID